MNNLSRAIAVFSSSFSVLYVAAFSVNYAPFIFYPLLVRAFLTKQGPEAGPAMFYYGWFVAALIGATAVTLTSLAIPLSWTRRIPTRLSWIVVILAILTLFYLERRWFLG